MRLDYDAYAELPWGALILDEAQFVKNHQSKVHQCARRLPAPFKLAITGTPLENSLVELWALLSLTAPGLFPSRRKFTETYQRPIERGEDAAALARLRRRVKPLMLRRTKESVDLELPPKLEQTIEVELSPAHRRIYDTRLQRERQKVLGLLDDLDRQRFIVFRSLTLLRMLALAPGLVDERDAHLGSAKLDVLLERLATRTTNPYGRSEAERAEVVGYVETVEPLLRAGASLELDGRRPVAELADAVEALLT